MKLICAWCRKENKPDVMGIKEPASDPTETHGLCPEHRKQVEAEIAEYRRTMKKLQEMVDP